MEKGICKICGKETDELDEHHLIQKSKGGSNSSDNKIKVCKDCHYKIHHPEWEDGDINQFNSEYKELLANNIFSDGWGIIPRKVLLDKEISSTAKLVYCEISSLSAERGYCWASNKYLAEKLNVSTITISNCLTQLEKFVIFEDRTSYKRKIWIHNLRSTPQRKLYSNLKENFKVNLKENFKHNNISNNKSNNKNIEFSIFWDLYDKKKGLKEKVEKKWNSLTDKDRENIIRYIPKYKLEQPDKLYRKHPMTFLNNESWKDEIISNDKLKKKKLYFQGSPVRIKADGSKWVIRDGEWLEFAGDDKDLEIKYE